MLQMNRTPYLCLSRGRWAKVRPPRCPAPSPTPVPRLLPSLPGVTWDGKTFSPRRLIMASWGQHLPWASSLPGKTTTSSYLVASDTRVGGSKKQRRFSKWCVRMWSQLICKNTQKGTFFSPCFYRCSWDKEHISLHRRSDSAYLHLYCGVQSSQQGAIPAFQRNPGQYCRGDKQHSYHGDPPSGAETSPVYPVSGQQHTGQSQPHTFCYTPSQ